jgi:7,8-dihydropterin-6-yl-methyl-4-(beta-D-ribofuranosyl)aminobenzene 5'-phosphate synthase
MKISVLAENSVCSNNIRNVKSEHGISLYVEFEEKRILFDVGQSDLFLQNAKKMGIDLSQVDYLIISHGHYDHGGGLRHFLKINKKAKVFLHRYAFHKYYAKILGFIPYYIGLNQKTISDNLDRIHFIDKDKRIDDKLIFLEGFQEEFPQPDANNALFERLNKHLVPDKFKHELGLLLPEKDGMVLFSGCSHSGIINIIRKSNEYSDNKKIKAVFGGFHIHNPTSKKDESPVYIGKLTEAIGEIDSVFYTGHCTGETNYRFMKEKLGNKIQTMNSGEYLVV